MKKIIFLLSFTGLSFFFNACSVGYVSEEPTYVAVVRPQPPSSTHIWIEGNWYWNSRTHTYTQGEGSWVYPSQDRTFVRGYWKKNKHGYRWMPNRWQ